VFGLLHGRPTSRGVPRKDDRSLEIQGVEV
jgi:hypothetical protein